MLSCDLCELLQVQHDRQALCWQGHQDMGPVSGDNEVVAVASRENFIFHCKSKMSLLSASVWAGDCQCILIDLLLDFMNAGICRFAFTWGEFWKQKIAPEGFSVDCIHSGGVSFGH